MLINVIPNFLFGWQVFSVDAFGGGYEPVTIGAVEAGLVPDASKQVAVQGDVV